MRMTYKTSRRKFAKATGGAIALASVAGCSNSTESGLTLSWADPWPNGHFHHTNSRDMFTERVTELSDTEVSWNIQSSGEIGGSGEMLSIAQNNLADVVHLSPSYFSGQFPLSMSTVLPGAYSNVENGNQTFWELSQGVLQEEELSDLGLRAVGVSLTPPYLPTITTDNKIETLEDFEGLSLRSAGGIMGTTIQNLGASPTEIPPEDVVSSIERDVIDGLLLNEASVASYGLIEQVQYLATGASLTGFASFMAISSDRFNELPSDVQDAMVTAGEDIALEAGVNVDELVSEYRQDFRDNGADVYEIPDEEYQRWLDAAQPAINQWESNTQEAGKPTASVLDAWGLE